MASIPLTFRDRFLASLIAGAGVFYLSLIGLTSRIRVHRSAGLCAREEKKIPIIFAFWHRFQLLLVYVHRRRGVHVLVSRSRDGEFIARALHCFGFRTTRGSSSRGGGAAFRELCDVVARGGAAAFTPDGPRGPFRSVQPGVIALAVRTGVPVVPIAWAGTRVKELNSWDRFMIPGLFGRYAVVYGEPLAFSEEGAGSEERLRAALDAVAREAEQKLGETGC